MSQPAVEAASSYHPHLRSGRSRSAVFGVLWSSVHTLMPILGSTLAFYVSALFLSPDELGIFSLASSFAMTAVAISPVAFGEALVQRADITKSNADSVFWMAMTVGVLLFAGLGTGSPFIARMVGEPEIAALLPVLALRVPLDLAAAVPNAMIVRSMNFKFVALRTTVATAVSLVLTLTLLWSGYGYWALAVSQVCSSLVICAMAYWASGWRPGLSFDMGALKQLAHYGLFASGTRMLTTMRLDHMLLGALGGTAMLGLFFFAQRLYMMLSQFVGGALSSVTHALLSSLQDDQEKTARAFCIASFSAATVSLPMFALLALLAPDILALLFDERWQAAAFAVQAFAVMGCIAGVSVVQGAFIRSQGKADWWFYYQLFQQATSLVVIALTFKAGLETLMVVLIAKSVLVWPISLYLTVRLLDVGMRAYLAAFLAPALATLAMIASVLAVPPLAPALPLPASLALQLLIGAAIYLAVFGLVAKRRIAEIITLIRAGRTNRT